MQIHGGIGNRGMCSLLRWARAVLGSVGEVVADAVGRAVCGHMYGEEISGREGKVALYAAAVRSRI